MAVSNNSSVSVAKLPWTCHAHMVWNLSCNTCKDAMAKRTFIREGERITSTGRIMGKARS